MAHKQISPHSVEALGKILTPMAANIGSIATPFGIDPGVVTKVQNCKKNVDWINGVSLVAKQEKEQITKFKADLCFGKLNMMLQPITVTVPSTPPATLDSGITTFIMGLIKTIKANPLYTEEIGKLLGIIGAEEFIDFTTVKSKLKMKVSNPEGIEFTFNLLGAENVAIFRYIYDPSAPIPANYDDVPWVKVAVLSHSPYIDKTLNIAHKPETRVYKSRLVKNDKLVGIESDVLHVSAAVYIDEDGTELSGKVK